MAANAGILVGWTRAVPGNDAEAVGRFGEFLDYLGKLQAEGRIESFEPVMVAPHGGDLGGFVLVRGEGSRLDELRRSDGWQDWETWGSFTLQGFGMVNVYLGDGIAARMARFLKLAQS